MIRTITLSLLALAGCTPHAVKRDPVAPVTLPEAFAEAAPGQAAPARWWEAFSDPALSAQVQKLLGQSLDLKQSAARIAQAKAQAALAGSSRWPTVEGRVGVTRARGYDFLGNSQTGNRYDLSVAASYEIDAWGRVESLADAADADVLATRLDMESLAQTLVGQLVESWYAAAEQRAQKALVDAQIATNAQFLELVELRFGNGLASAVDVLQQREQIARLRAQLPLIEARRQLFEHQVALLSGESARPVDGAATLPDLPPVPAVGVPGDLLKRRPDIRAAQLRAVATDHRVAAAIADRFPALRLTASTGFQADDLGDLIDRWIWSLAGNLVLPIIDGGRRKTQVQAQRAALKAQLAGFGAAVLRAAKEVQDALVQEARQREHLDLLDAQLATSRALLGESRARYIEGLTDYLPVLTALRGVQGAEQSRLSAQRQLLSHRISLYRALGGDWSRSLEEAP
jgi:outer membrane protein, multidrug efflux system